VTTRAGVTSPIPGFAGQGLLSRHHWETTPFAQVIWVCLPNTADWVSQLAKAGVIRPSTKPQCVLIERVLWTNWPSLQVFTAGSRVSSLNASICACPSDVNRRSGHHRKVQSRGRFSNFSRGTVRAARGERLADADDQRVSILPTDPVAAGRFRGSLWRRSIRRGADRVIHPPTTPPVPHFFTTPRPRAWSTAEATNRRCSLLPQLEFDGPDLLQGSLSELKLAVQRQATPGRILLRDKLTFLAGVTGCLCATLLMLLLNTACSKSTLGHRRVLRVAKVCRDLPAMT